MLKSALLSTAAAVALASAAGASTLITEDFDGPTQIVTGSYSLTSVQNLPTPFNGNMMRSNRGSVAELVLTNLAPYDTLSLQFDYAELDSWDAAGNWGPDVFNIAINGTIVTSHQSTNSPAAGFTLVNSEQHFGFNAGWTDSTFTFAQTYGDFGSDVTISFFANGPSLQWPYDESWAIDNLIVQTSSTPAVPLPASGLLLLAGVGGLAAARRR